MDWIPDEGLLGGDVKCKNNKIVNISWLFVLCDLLNLDNKILHEASSIEIMALSYYSMESLNENILRNNQQTWKIWNNILLRNTKHFWLRRRRRLRFSKIWCEQAWWCPNVWKLLNFIMVQRSFDSLLVIQNFLRLGSW